LGKLRVTLIRSVAGRPQTQRRTIRSMGLKKLHQTVEHPDSAQIRGQINKVKHLVKVEEIDA